MPINPILTGQATYPFVRLEPGCSRAPGRGPRGDRLRHGRSARAHRPADHRGAQRRRARADGLPGCGRPARAARGGRRVGRPPVRSRARPGRQRDSDARLEGGDLLVRERRARPRRRPGHGRPDRAGLSRRRARGAVRRCPGRRAAAARGARLSPRPRRGAGRDVAAHGALLGQLPEQPDRRHGADRVLRAAGGARARARLRARLRRGVHASSGSTSRPSRRSSSATGRTWRRSTRCRSARR